MSFRGDGAVAFFASVKCHSAHAEADKASQRKRERRLSIRRWQSNPAPLRVLVVDDERDTG